MRFSPSSPGRIAGASFFQNCPSDLPDRLTKPESSFLHRITASYRRHYTMLTTTTAATPSRTSQGPSPSRTNRGSNSSLGPPTSSADASDSVRATDGTHTPRPR